MLSIDMVPFGAFMITLRASGKNTKERYFNLIFVRKRPRVYLKIY
jgi:hypothetical protein